jgi:hypothetical protein
VPQGGAEVDGSRSQYCEGRDIEENIKEGIRRRVKEESDSDSDSVSGGEENNTRWMVDGMKMKKAKGKRRKAKVRKESNGLGEEKRIALGGRQDEFKGERQKGIVKKRRRD